MGGAELSVRHYAKQFGPKWPLFAYSLRKATHQIFEGLPIQTTEGENGNWQCYIKYFRYCLNNRKDIFHLHNAGPIIAFITVLAGVKNPIYHIHGTIYWHNTKQKIYLKFVWFLLRFFRLTYVGVSEHSAKIFTRDAIKRDPLIIYNGLETRPFQNKLHKRTTIKKIGYAGRLFKGKNVDLVIRLFEEVAAEYPEMELHIAGDGALRSELEEQAQQGGYADRIKFLGFINDMPSFYADMDAFVFLSAYESFGNVLAEALLTGCPVLTSDIPVFKEIYGEDSDFLLGDYRNYEQITQNFKAALANYSRLADQAYALSDEMRERFSIEKHLCQIEQLYENY